MSSKTALNEDGWRKNNGSSSKTALYEDGLRKNNGSSSKTGLNEDGWQKKPGLSSKTALYEDGWQEWLGKRCQVNRWNLFTECHLFLLVRAVTAPQTKRKPRRTKKLPFCLWCSDLQKTQEYFNGTLQQLQQLQQSQQPKTLPLPQQLLQLFLKLSLLQVLFKDTAPYTAAGRLPGFPWLWSCLKNLPPGRLFLPGVCIPQRIA